MQVWHKQCTLAGTQTHAHARTHNGDFSLFQSCKQLAEEWCVASVSHPEIIKPLIYWEPAAHWSPSHPQKQTHTRVCTPARTHTHTPRSHVPFTMLGLLLVNFLVHCLLEEESCLLKDSAAIPVLRRACAPTCSSVCAHTCTRIHTGMCVVLTSPQACLPAYFTLMPPWLYPG